MAREVGKPDGGLAYYDWSDNAAEGDPFEIVYLGERSGYDWNYLRWNNSGNLSTELVGCTRAGQDWPSNGMALVRFANGTEDIYLFGNTGWNSQVPLR